MHSQIDRLALFPFGSAVNEHGRLVLGGCDVLSLCSQFGTPLYVYDESTIRRMMRVLKGEFGRRYPDVRVLYACKAFSNKSLLRIVSEEGLGLDVVSGGEIEIAHSIGFAMGTISFAGNNKSRKEIELALKLGVGRVVVDNLDELLTLDAVAASRGVRQKVLLRITPGIDPHTHRYEATGLIDSKFGFPLALGDEAVRAAMSLSHIDPVGLHFHVGSQLLLASPYEQAIAVVLSFAAQMQRLHDCRMEELSVGGGYPVQYTLDGPVPGPSVFAESITSKITNECTSLRLVMPRLVIEPGRSVVAQAGVALYEVGTRKIVPGVRTYVSVDGGMADNIAPALYQLKMECVLANRMSDSNGGVFTISGKFCESGDVLVSDIALPVPAPGDLLAIPCSGAYNISQSCNYNAFCRPAVIMVKDGEPRLIRRRETVDDLLACDV
jgi:diaminopimelate decarboxylase